jgi:hypothetical protein
MLKFQNLKLNLDVDNVVLYQFVNVQLKIPYIRVCAKMKKKNQTSLVVNSVNFQNIKIFQFLTFLCSPQYKLF